MNRQDAERLAGEYARRRVREGADPATAVSEAVARYRSSITTVAEIRLLRQLVGKGKR